MSYARPKLAFTDTPGETIAKLADGSLGAETVLRRLMAAAAWVDPGNALGPRAAMYSLDGLDIYGERIVQFYRDVCADDPATALGALRAIQLGLLPAATLDAAINGSRLYTDVIAAAVAEVKKQVPDFGLKTPLESTGLRGLLDLLSSKISGRPACEKCKAPCDKAPGAPATAATAEPSPDPEKAHPNIEEISDFVARTLEKKMGLKPGSMHATLIPLGPSDLAPKPQ